MSYPGDHNDARDERHPHIIAKENLEQIVKGGKVDEETTREAKKQILVLDGIINLATSITQAYPEVCYMNACDLIEQFLFDPLHEQS